MVDADPPINKNPLSLMSEAVARPRDGQTSGIYNISFELIKVRGKTMIYKIVCSLELSYRNAVLQTRKEVDHSYLERKKALPGLQTTGALC